MGKGQRLLDDLLNRAVRVRTRGVAQVKKAS